MAGWGTGKTLFGILRALDLSQEIPNNTGLIVRKEYTDLRDSLCRDFEKYTGLKINSKKEVYFPNGSIIMFRHGAELRVLQNINLGWFMIEQAEEFETEEQFEFLRGRLRRDVPFHTGFIVANTKGHNWIWRLWKNNPPSDEYELVEATTFDNEENLPPDFIEDLKKLEKESPTHYKQYVLNSWEDLEEQDLLIPYEIILEATKINFRDTPDAKVILSCDVARYGDCRTVFTILKQAQGGWRQDYLLALRGQNLMQTTGRIVDLLRTYHPNYIVIDDVGLGGGVVDRLRELNINAIPFNGGEKVQEEGFLNKRALCYWQLRELLEQRRLALIASDKQTEQLRVIKFSYRSDGKKRIETKEEMRKRGLASPDFADALMMAVSMIPAASAINYKSLRVQRQKVLAGGF